MEDKLYIKEDHSSFSNSDSAISTHIKLEWDLDFNASVIRGSCEHVVKILKAGVKEVSFDSASSIVLTSDVLVNGSKAVVQYGELHQVLGRRISVQVDSYEGQVLIITFFYEANSSASAVQWLPPSATKGGKYPYVFTQSQAIHARSLVYHLY